MTVHTNHIWRLAVSKYLKDLVDDWKDGRMNSGDLCMVATQLLEAIAEIDIALAKQKNE